jgi:hypothetical protein
MVSKKGLSGSPGGYYRFWIRRFYCKTTGRTVSIHPRFSHSYKRYTLAFVIAGLSALIEEKHSAYGTAKEFGLPRQTLHRWNNSLTDVNIAAKWACFFHGGLPSPDTDFSTALLKFFRKSGNGDQPKGTALAMVCLHEGFSCSLY